MAHGIGQQPDEQWNEILDHFYSYLVYWLSAYLTATLYYQGSRVASLDRRSILRTTSLTPPAELRRRISRYAAPPQARCWARQRAAVCVLTCLWSGS